MRKRVRERARVEEGEGEIWRMDEGYIGSEGMGGGGGVGE